MTEVFDGVAVPPGRYIARGAPRAGYLATLGALTGALGPAMGGLGVWDWLVTDASIYNCPPDCGHPPSSVPVAELPRFVAPGDQFSVSYPAAGSAYVVTTDETGVTARYTGGDGGVLRLTGEPAQGRVARRVVADVIARQFPNPAVAYELPNAMVGYQLGYGVVVDFHRTGLPTRVDMRGVVMAAVKDGVALIGYAEGPFRRFTADFGPGPPSAANMELAMDMGKYVESFRWKGDPPR